MCETSWFNLIIGQSLGYEALSAKNSTKLLFSDFKIVYKQF